MLAERLAMGFSIFPCLSFFDESELRRVNCTLAAKEDSLLGAVHISPVVVPTTIRVVIVSKSIGDTFPIIV